MKTADLCDQFENQIAVCELQWHSYGKKREFDGPICTVKVYEDNTLVREALETVPSHSVLVIDGGGSTRCALVGGNLAQLAEKRNLSGIIVYGCVRDVEELAACNIGILALGSCPRKSIKAGHGFRDIALHFGNITWTPNAHLYADEDGIVVSTLSIGT